MGARSCWKPCGFHAEHCTAEVCILSLVFNLPSFPSRLPPTSHFMPLPPPSKSGLSAGPGNPAGPYRGGPISCCGTPLPPLWSGTKGQAAHLLPRWGKGPSMAEPAPWKGRRLSEWSGQGLAPLCVSWLNSGELLPLSPVHLLMCECCGVNVTEWRKSCSGRVLCKCAPLLSSHPESSSWTCAWGREGFPVIVTRIWVRETDVSTS